MVEGAQIDKRAHENNFAGVIQEVLDFDKAVAEAIAFADKDKTLWSLLPLTMKREDLVSKRRYRPIILRRKFQQ